MVTRQSLLGRFINQLCTISSTQKLIIDFQREESAPQISQWSPSPSLSLSLSWLLSVWQSTYPRCVRPVWLVHHCCKKRWPLSELAGLKLRSNFVGKTSCSLCCWQDVFTGLLDTNSASWPSQQLTPVTLTRPDWRVSAQGPTGRICWSDSDSTQLHNSALNLNSKWGEFLIFNSW